MPMRFSLPPVYPITDKRLAGKPTHLAIVRELVRGGARIIQIRDKETPLRELLADIKRCSEHTARFGVRLIVNDRCDLALLGGAAGVHLGQEDLSPNAARTVLGRRAVIGLSTNTPAQVRRANRLPVQYIGFGPIFATATKPDHSPVVGLAALRRVSILSARPVVAIGGIDLERIPEVLEAGAASAAVISTLMQARSLARRMEQLLKAAGRP
jgi:thiamine-phosphate pyrophosphorylase